MVVGGGDPLPVPVTGRSKKKPLRFGTGGADQKIDQNPRDARRADTTTTAQEIRPNEASVLQEDFIAEKGAKMRTADLSRPSPEMSEIDVGAVNLRTDGSCACFGSKTPRYDRGPLPPH